MPVVDITTALERTYDVCVVGSGPAGMAAALRLSESGHSVVMIEAGGETPTAGPPAEMGSKHTHAALKDTNCQALGGTSWLWGGRIIPLAEYELVQNKWPILFDSFARHLDEAAIFLGGSILDRPFVNEHAQGAFDLEAVEMLAIDGSLSKKQAQRLSGPKGPDIVLSTSVVGLILSEAADGGTRCAGVTVPGAEKGTTRHLSANTTIIACGGVETARLLLAAQARAPEQLNHLRHLGRGYCGHLTGSVSQIALPSGVKPDALGWRARAGGGFERRVFRSARSSIEAGANMFFWARNWPKEDADHRSGIQSLKHILSLLKPKGDTAVETGPAAFVNTKASPLSQHLRNLFVDAPTSLKAAPDAIRSRRNNFRLGLDHLIPNGENRYKLCYHAEQSVSDSNHIQLAGPVTENELPEIKITYDYSDADIDAVVRAHETLAQELAATGTAEVIYDVAPDKLHSEVREKAHDGYHQIGTARMGSDATDSVVDSDCKLHGISGIYLAGSSVFPSSGAVPPTQSIVALSLRLADHLAKVVLKTAPQQTEGAR